jgi:hypothetical protein
LGVSDKGFQLGFLERVGKLEPLQRSMPYREGIGDFYSIFGIGSQKSKSVMTFWRVE